MYRHLESKLFSAFFRFHVEPPVLANRDFGAFRANWTEQPEQTGSKPLDKTKSLVNFFRSRSTFRAFSPDLSYSYSRLEAPSRMGVPFCHNLVDSSPSFHTKGLIIPIPFLLLPGICLFLLLAGPATL